MARPAGSLRAISGPPSRQPANRHRVAWPLHMAYRTWHMVRLLNAARAIFCPPGILFSNEKACYSDSHNYLQRTITFGESLSLPKHPAIRTPSFYFSFFIVLVIHERDASYCQLCYRYH